MLASVIVHRFSLRGLNQRVAIFDNVSFFIMVIRIRSNRGKKLVWHFLESKKKNMPSCHTGKLTLVFFNSKQNKTKQKTLLTLCMISLQHHHRLLPNFNYLQTFCLKLLRNTKKFVQCFCWQYLTMCAQHCTTDPL